MLPPKDRLTICFAHVAYQLQERFLARQTGIASFQLRSAAEAAELAMKRWLRLTANMSLGAYEVFEATGDLPEPEWPDLPFPEILKIAFRDHVVDRADHPLVQRLRGQV